MNLEILTHRHPKRLCCFVIWRVASNKLVVVWTIDYILGLFPINYLTDFLPCFVATSIWLHLKIPRRCNRFELWRKSINYWLNPTESIQLLFKCRYDFTEQKDPNLTSVSSTCTGSQMQWNPERFASSLFAVRLLITGLYASVRNGLVPTLPSLLVRLTWNATAGSQRGAGWGKGSRKL